MELLREAIEAYRLPVSLRIRHPEVALDVLLGRGALLLCHDHDRPPRELGDAADDRGVVAEGAIAMQLLEAVEDAPDDLEGMGARDVARGLHRLPRRGPTGRELRRVGDESRLDREVAVAFRGAARAHNAVEHGHASGASRKSCAYPRSGPPRPRSRGAREGAYLQIQPSARTRRRRPRRPGAGGDACEFRDVALEAPAQVLARDAERVEKERDPLLELRTGDDLIDEAVLEQEFGALESFRQLFADRLAGDARARESDQSAGLGEHDVAERRDRGEHTD